MAIESTSRVQQGGTVMAKKRIVEVDNSVEEPIVTPEPEIVEEVIEEPKKFFGKVNALKLNVRKGPSASDVVIKVISNGDTIELESLDMTSGFYKTKDGNYVMADFITVQ